MPSPDTIRSAPLPASDDTRSPSHDSVGSAEFAQCQELFAAGTGLGLTLIDADFRPLLLPSAHNPLAQAWLHRVGHLSAFADQCAGPASEGEVRVKSVALDPFEVIAAPIHVNGEPPLLLVAGPLLPDGSHDAEQLRAFAAQLDIDVSTLEEGVAALRERAAVPRDTVTSSFEAVVRLVSTHVRERARARRREAELTALSELSVRVGASLDPVVVLDGVLDRALDLLGCRQGSVMLLDEPTNELCIARSRGLDEEIVRQARVPMGEGIAGYVAQSGQPKNLHKGFKDRYSQTDETAEEVKAALCVPLVARNEVIGVLNVSDRVDDDDFSERDLELLQALAAQAAAAIANAKLFESSADMNRQLLALTEISAQVASSLDPQGVLNGVLDHALGLLRSQQGSIMLLDDDRAALTIAASRGLDDAIASQVRVPMGQGIAGYVAQSGEAKNLRKGFKDRYSQTDEAADEMKAALCVPLRTRNEVIGVLNVSDRVENDDFADADLELLQALATQAAVAIANATLYDASENRNEQLSALFALGVQVSEAVDRDRDRVLQAVMDRAAELSRARKGSVMLRDEDGEHLRIVAASGLEREIIAKARPRIGEGIAGTVAQTGEPAVFRRGQRDQRSKSQTDRDSAVCIPLEVRGEVIGVLNVSDKADGGDFSEEEVQLLSHLARQAAIAIHLATLQAELHAMFMGTVRALANAIDARDPYTERHSERVAEFSVAMARQMGLEDEEVEYIRVAGMLHDVGKIGIKEAILGKPGRLDAAEFREMQSHPVRGAKILEPVEQESVRFRKMVPWMKYHHEKFSAEGYPDGLHGEDIPLPARIIAVADTYDAMTSDRPYRKGLPHKVATEEIQKCSGEQFDPLVVQAFLECDADGQIEPIRQIK